MSELKAHRIDNIISAYKIGKAFCMKTEEEVYIKSEADKVIAEKDAEIAQLQAMLEERNKQVGELKSDIADLRDDKKLTDVILDERNAEIAELKEKIEVLKNQACKMNCMMVKHYNEVCDDNIHQKYKRCLAMAELCRAKRNEIIARTPTLILNHPTEYLTKWENRWLELTEKFKEAK